jgi:hypothetical protein
MVQPINYAIEIPDPSQAFLQAFKTGSAVTEARLAQEQAARQAEQQKQVQEAFARLRQPGATARDYANLSMLLPETQAKAVRESFNMLNADQQQASRTQAGQVFSAFRSGRPDIAIGLIDSQIQAKRNTGDEAGAKFLETWRDVAKENPNATEDYFGGILAEMPGGKDVLEGALKISAERRTQAMQPETLRKAVADADAAVADAQKKVAEAANTPDRLKAEQDLRLAQAQKAQAEARVAEATEPFKISEAQSTSIIKAAEAKFAPDKFGAELGLTQAQIESARAARRASDAAAAKSGADAKRAQAEANQMAAGIIPVEKRPEAEGKFRREYSEQTKGYQEVKSAYGRVLASEDSAVGDLSLIFGYMKMLDPGSVVREGEFATAQNAAGVPERIQNVYNQVVSGQRLSPSQRTSFKGQAGKLYSTAQTQEATVRQGIERIAKGYGLNTANIFYEATESPPPGAGAAPPAAGGGRGAPVSVTAPNGQVLTFPSQQAADAFKKAAGIR